MNSRSVAGSFPHQGDPERLAYTVSLNSLAGLDVTSVPVTCSSAWGTAAWAEIAETLSAGENSTRRDICRYRTLASRQQGVVSSEGRLHPTLAVRPRLRMVWVERHCRRRDA
jgi:hypothetical protein